MSSPRSTPSAEGVDPAGLHGLLDALERDPGILPRGVIVHRHGRRIAEGYWAPHRAGDRPLVYSLSKSFTSAALGLAIAEGAIGLDETVEDVLPDRLSAAGERARRIRVRHLASMSSGYDREMLLPALERNPLDPLTGLFSFVPEHEPGSWFQYNQPPFFGLAVAVQNRVGALLSDYLRPRLTDPLDLPPLASQRYGSAPGWEGGWDLGFSGMHTTLDAIAELGQLHLDDGVRGDRRLLPEGWVAQASAVQIDTPREGKVDWREGYGFGLWRARHGYRGDGAFGQFMIVLPEQDAVVAIFSETFDMQSVVDAVWENLLPAIDRRTGDAADAADSGLERRLAALTTPTAVQRGAGGEVGAVHADLRREAGDSGDTGDSGDAGAQPALSRLELRGDEVVVTEGSRTMTLPLGREGWAFSGEHPFAVSSAASDGRISLDVVGLEMPHTLRIRARPDRGTFRAEWVTSPIGPPRIGDTLLEMRSPA